MTIGCLLGLLLLKLFDSRKVLIVTSGAALLLLSLALFGSARVSVIAFPGTGLFASMMWPIIISLDSTQWPNIMETVSGILCTGIAGGAVVPLLIGPDWRSLGTSRRNDIPVHKLRLGFRHRILGKTADQQPEIR